MEEDLIKIEKEIKSLEQGKVNTANKPVNMEQVMKYIEYFLEHLEELVLESQNPLKRAAYFGLLFDQTPTYEELLFRTPKLAPYLGLKQSVGTALVPVGEPGWIRTIDAQLKRLSLCH